LRAKPDIVNHNLETIERLGIGWPDQAAVIPARSNCCGGPRRWIPARLTKSGIICGLGEDWASLLVAMRTCARRRGHPEPSPVPPSSSQHLPIARYYTPDEFAALRRHGLEMGYRHVEAGPLVRSSYHASEQVERATATR